jgi:bis(5'-nucleosyl)-tetraphosphatase (symmetrical)
MNRPGIYAVGDIQGCLHPLRRLIRKSAVDLDRDQLWVAGDMVNRGPQSVETLRYIKSLSEQMGDRLKVVLGNHDLHLLAMAHGIRKSTPGLSGILEAPDRIELLEWLRHRPLMVRDVASKSVLVHAGVYPPWKIKQAASYAQEVETILRGPNAAKLLEKMYGNRPARWSSDLQGWPRYRFIINSMTRMRFCTRQGGLNLNFDGPPGTQSRKLYPWYQLPMVSRKNWRIVFGHFSYAGAWFNGNFIALDSGCVYGEKMTMARTDLRKITFCQTDCKHG